MVGMPSNEEWHHVLANVFERLEALDVFSESFGRRENARMII
jgi:hypothetical protein